MNVSLKKLLTFLKSFNIDCISIYGIDNICIYLKLISVENGKFFLLYIPSKYEINYNSESSSIPYVKINYIDINEDGSIPVDYGGGEDIKNIEECYNEIDTPLNLNTDEKKLEESLMDNYNYPVSLKDVSSEDMNIIKNIFRQLRRFKFFIQNLDYRICISYKYYMCFFTRKNNYECISHNKMVNNRNLTITIDLELLYVKLEDNNILTKDLGRIYLGINDNINRNQNKHFNYLREMLQYNSNLDIENQSIFTCKKQNKSYLKKLQKMLENIIRGEKTILEDINNIKNKYSHNYTSVTNDIQKSHLLSSKLKELSEIHEIKNDIIDNICNINEKIQDISLNVDQIYFDNIIMLNKIIKNFKKLNNIQ